MEWCVSHIRLDMSDGGEHWTMHPALPIRSQTEGGVLGGWAPAGNTKSNLWIKADDNLQDLSASAKHEGTKMNAMRQFFCESHQ